MRSDGAIFDTIGFSDRSARAASQLLRLAGQQWNETHVDQLGPLNALSGTNDLHQPLMLLVRAERQHHDAADRELVHERWRHSDGRRGHDDAVERRPIGCPHHAVASNDLDIVAVERPETAARRVSKRAVTLNARYPGGKP